MRGSISDKHCPMSKQKVTRIKLSAAGGLLRFLQAGYE